jgi:ATP-dependent helicase/nuclease subunit B
MSLGFIVGPAGSGKTRRIIDLALEAVRDGSNQPVLILVPDQATFQMEKEVLKQANVDGFMDLHIVSFRRLCLGVLHETGGLDKPFITATGKRMAVQSILWKRKSDLKVYSPMVTFPGFRDSIIKIFSELISYNIDVSEMMSVTKASEVPVLSQKLGDIKLILDDYKSFLEGRFIDPDDYMSLAKENFRYSSLIKGARIFVDGFSGLNPREYEVLGELMRFAQSVQVALCLDEEELSFPPSDMSVFRPTRETYERLKKIVSDLGIKEMPLEILGKSTPLPRFRASSDLGVLENRIKSHLGCHKTSKPEKRTQEIPSVRILATQNPMGEVEFVAREILKLVRDCGYRFSDITIQTRDLNRYASIISLVFSDYNIPHFIDQKKSLSHHPLLELVRAALDSVATGFSFEAVMRYLKTDLVPLERSQVDILENYVLAHGIHGELWVSEKAWRFSKRLLLDEEILPEVQEKAVEVDAIRRRAISHLSQFYRQIKSCGHLSAKILSNAIYDLLINLGVPKTLEEWQSLAQDAGDIESAMEHGAVWDSVMEIMEQSAEILGEEACDLKTYIAIINAGLEDIRLGVIPPSLDQVLVGNINRSRQPECKATFLMGVLAGVFPATKEEDSLIDDRDRDYLSSRGIELEASSKERQLDENYLVYIALTRSHERLYISYPLGDEEGKGLSPSHIIEYIKKCLPEIEEELVPQDPPGFPNTDLDYVVPARIQGATVRMLSKLREGNYPGDIWMAAYRHLALTRSPSLNSLSFSNEVQPLDRNRVRALYGRTILTSVSRLERFGQCPFQHFARDGLGLKERDVFKMEPSTAGTFLHETMKAIVDQISKDSTSWRAFLRDGADSVVDQVMDQMIPNVAGEILTSSARHKEMGESFRRIAKRASWILHEHARKSKFEPIATEVRFGFEEGMPPLAISVSPKDTVLLRGQIDRIDIASYNDRAYVRIVDYKSSDHSLDIQSVYEGLSLQLLVYMIAALSLYDHLAKYRGLPSKPPVPAGALYFSVRDPIIPVDGPLNHDDAARRIKKELKMSGLLSGDYDVMRLMDSDGTGYSELIPVQFTKAESLGQNSSCVSHQDFRALLKFVEHKVREMSSRLFSGDISINPYRMGQVRACTYCPYTPLCTFDVLVPGSKYRVIPRVSKEEVWQEISAKVGGIVGDN